jgi:hypothetical protein
MNLQEFNIDIILSITEHLYLKDTLQLLFCNRKFYSIYKNNRKDIKSNVYITNIYSLRNINKKFTNLKITYDIHDYSHAVGYLKKNVDKNIESVKLDFFLNHYSTRCKLLNLKNLPNLKHFSSELHLYLFSELCSNFKFLEHLETLKIKDYMDMRYERPSKKINIDLNFLNYTLKLKKLHIEYVLPDNSLTNKLIILNYEYIGNLMNLNYLHLENVVIMDYTFISNLSSLNYLYLENNYIKQYDSNAFENITISNVGLLIDFGFKPIKYTSIDFAYNLEELEYCKISGNYVENFKSICLLKKIKTLNLSHNYISVKYEDLSEFSNITSLDLSYNRIKDIKFIQTLISLKELYLCHNHIDSLLPLEKLINLSILCINKNKDHISHLSIDSLKFLVNLEHLELNRNNIDDISSLKFLVNLEHLELNRNNIDDISSLKYLVNLVHLEINYNIINDISSLSNLTKLKILKINNNKIYEIDCLNLCSRLTDLDLSYNKIENISVISNMIKMSNLNLSYNKISNISYLRYLFELKKIKLKKNKIESLKDLYKLPKLIYLDTTLNNSLHVTEKGFDDMYIQEHCNIKNFYVINKIDNGGIINVYRYFNHNYGLEFELI